jgi:ribosomal protein S18 acetylase RimI-like enzyme
MLVPSSNEVISFGNSDQRPDQRPNQRPNQRQLFQQTLSISVMQTSLMSDQTSIEFTWAFPEHLADILQVQEQSGTSWPHPKSFFEESLVYQRMLLARQDKTPIAYLLYEVIWGNTAFLSLLKVLPDYQRKGVGTSMVKLLEDRLVSLGFKSYVTSSETTNPNTKRFFPNLGFTQIGELQMQHGEEIFYLKKLQ